MFHIVICDDDILFVNHITEIFLKAGLKQSECIFYKYTSELDFIDNLSNFTTVDLLLLDIDFPTMNGNIVAQQFREFFPTALLVFCSGVFSPTVESFKPNPYRYLLKEYSCEQLIEEIKPIIEKLKITKTEPCIIGKWHNNITKLYPSEIMYVSIGRNHSIIYMNPELRKYEYENKITCKEKLPSIYNRLKDFHFEYAHNSYIVNLQYIKRKTFKELELLDGTILSIARSKEENLRKAFIQYVSEKY